MNNLDFCIGFIVICLSASETFEIPKKKFERALKLRLGYRISMKLWLSLLLCSLILCEIVSAFEFFDFFGGNNGDGDDDGGSHFGHGGQQRQKTAHRQQSPEGNTR